MPKVDALRIDRDGSRFIRDTVAREVSFDVYHKRRKITTLLCSPKDLKELRLGYLHTSGFTKTKNNKGKVENLKISAKVVLKIMESFLDNSRTFKKTGGVHSAGLSNGKEIIVFKEDVGRHNALDKAIGEALIKRLDMKNLIILISSRVSSEIVLKVQKTGSPILVSRGAPTDQALNLAKRYKLTLIGFARGERMNLYTGEERIITNG